MPVEKGTLVQWTVKGQPRVGVVEGSEGKSSLRVADSLGNNLVVAERDLEYRSSDYRLKDRLVSDWGSWKSRVDEESLSIDLASVWELLDGTLGAQKLEVLADCLWGELTLERAYALFRALRDDRIFFKERAGSYERRTPAQVDEARKQVAASAARESVQAALVQRLEARLIDRQAPLEGEDLRRLQSVKNVALWGDEAPEKNLGLDLLKLMGRPQTEGSALQFLVDLGLWSVHENLDVHRAGLRADFDPEVLAAAASVERRDPARPLDLTGLQTVTIDDESTTEVDDAISLETRPDGTWRVWIHIADPGRWVRPGDVLDTEARRRGTTVYLPDQRITMFPPSLAETVFSLNPGVDTPALSFDCVVAPTGELVDASVSPSLIRVTERLSYDDAESRTDVLLSELERLASVRAALRSRQGAVSIQVPETKVTVSEGGRVLEIGVYAASRARDWVAEAMILAGEAAARAALAAGWPLLYRIQAPGEPNDVSHLPEGPAREFAKMSGMSKSGFSVDPAPHAGLGLSAYVQATSPIRRYADLAVHRQLKALAAGESPVYSADDLKALAAELDPLSSAAAKMERLADRYWITEFLARQKGRIWVAVFVGWFREDDRVAQVFLPELGFRTSMKLPRGKALGETFSVKVGAADARRELLTLVEASATRS